MKHRRRHARRHHAYANPSGAVDNPRHKHRRRHARRNPSHAARGGKVGFGEETKSLLLLSLEIGGVALASGLLIDKALSYAPITGNWLIAAKMAIGVLGGAGLAMALPKKYAAIPAGIAVGAVADGLSDLYHLYVAPQIASLTTPAARALPAGFTGVPAGYTAYSPQACAVGAR